MNTNQSPEAFRTIGWIRDEGRKIKYRVVRSDGSRHEELIAAALPTYTLPSPPRIIYGQVMVDDKGKRYVRQDDFYTYQQLYKPGETYRFEVVGAIVDHRSGCPRHLVTCGNGYRHLYISDCLEDVQEGESFECKVSVLKGKDEKAYIFLLRSADKMRKFNPKEVFQGIGHLDDFEPLFERLAQTYSLNERMVDLYEQVKTKVTEKNRLWMFDYLSILELLLFATPHQGLSEARRLALLIRDMENWIIGRSGLLGSFNADRREETRKRAVTTINDVEAMIMAIDLSTKGEQDTYFENSMDKIREGLPPEDTAVAIRVIRMLAMLEEGFLIRNTRSWAWMITLSLGRDWDSLIMQRIVKAAVGWVNESLRTLLKPVHFDSGRIAPDSETGRVILLAGTLVDFGMANSLKKGNDYSVDSQFLIVSLCKIVSFLVPKHAAIDLLKKGIEVLMASKAEARFSLEALENAVNDPSLLLSELMNIQTRVDSGILYDTKGALLMTYDKGILGIARIGTKIGKRNLMARLRRVGTFPSLDIELLDAQGIDTPSLGSVGESRDYWKALLERTDWTLEALPEEKPEDSRLIRVKETTPRYDGLIFCHMERPGDEREGVIGYRDYARNFRWPVLTELFEPGMLFKADIIREGRNRYHFDITGELMAFSRDKAHLYDEQDALCIGVSNDVDRSFFITERFAMVTCKTPEGGCKIGESYRIQIIQSVGGEYPGGIVKGRTSAKLDARTLLRAQLKSISDRNIAERGDVAEGSKMTAVSFPYLHLILDLFQRFVKEEVDRYNLLQLLRLLAIKEKSGLSILYTARILVMEARYAASRREPFTSSLPSFDWSPSTISVSEDMRQLHEEFLSLTTHRENMEDGHVVRKEEPASPTPKRGKEAKLRLIEGLIKEIAGEQDIEKVMSGIKELSKANTIEGDPIPGLTFYEDGSYAIEAEEEGVMSRENLRGFMMEVFSDGTVGKVPREVVAALEKGKVYPPSVRKRGRLKGLFSLDEADALVLWYVADGEHRIKVLPVEDVDQEERIGHAGTYRLPGKEVMVYNTLPLQESWVQYELLATPEGCPLKGSPYQNLIGKLNYKLKQHADAIEEADFLGDVKKGHFDKVRLLVNNLYLDRNRFVSVAPAMAEALPLIEDADLFWSLFSLSVYHKGLTYVLRMMEAVRGLAVPAPRATVIEEIMTNMLANPKWVNAVMNMAHLAWEWLSPTTRRRVLEEDTDSLTFESYLSYVHIAGMTSLEAVAFLEAKENPASKYALFETLRRGYEAGELSEEEVVAARERLPKGSLPAYFLRDLVTVGVLGEQPLFLNETGIKRIIRGGAAVFYSACQLRDAHEVAVFCQGDETDWIGRSIRATVETVYTNHYLVKGDMKAILVPKSWCKASYRVGDEIEVEVERITRKSKTIFAYEAGMASPLPEDPGILKVGDKVTVRFARYNKGYAVRLQGVYNRATFRIINQEERRFDPSRQYVGEVESANNDEMVYEIRLLERP